MKTINRIILTAFFILGFISPQKAQKLTDSVEVKLNRSNIIVRSSNQKTKIVFKKKQLQILSKFNDSVEINRTFNYAETWDGQLSINNVPYYLLVTSASHKVFLAFQTNTSNQFKFIRIAYDPNSNKIIFEFEFKGILYQNSNKIN